MTDRPSLSPPTIDPAAAARWHRAPMTQSPWLHEEVARRMVDRLAWIKAQPTTWCHWDPLMGGLQGHALVQAHYPQANCVAYESSPQRRASVQAGMRRPAWHPGRWLGPSVQFQAPQPASVQMLWANMALHPTAQPLGLLQQWHQALAIDGFLMFSCLGPDTLRELRHLYREWGWGPVGHDLTDMHDWGDMLLQAGFAEPVMDMERIVLTYDTSPRLLDELRSLGRNLHPARFAGLRGRKWRQQLTQGLQSSLASKAHDGRLSLTVEIIYGHALKPLARVPIAAQSQVSLQDMRQALARNRPGGGGDGRRGG